MNDFNASDYDRWLTTPPDDGYDYHDDLDLARHNALVADMAEQDDAEVDSVARPAAMTPTHHAIAALIAMHTPITTQYRLVAVPGTELTDACTICDDGNCPWCARGIAYEPPIYTDDEIAYNSQVGECRMNVLGTYWQICGAPADGPCHCDLFVKATDAGLCAECNGEGRTPNPYCTGDTAGGWADTCDTCHGTGKDVRGCEFCNVTHSPQNCPAIRAALMKEEPR